MISLHNVRRGVLALIMVCACFCGLVTSASASPSVRYVWPLNPQPEVTEPFDAPAVRWNPGHRGVDLAATHEQTVLAAGDGVVAFAGVVAGKPVVSIDHGAIRTTYEPVVASVTTGSAVRKGDPIGSVVAGHEGCAVETCVHWGAKRGDVYLDPLSLLRPRQVRLLPL